MKFSAIAASLTICLFSATVGAKTITVAANGSGDFKSVAEAVNAVPDNSDEVTKIHIKPGTYPGQISIPKSKANLTLEGEDASTTLMTWDHNVNDPIPKGVNKNNPGIYVAALDFHASRLTFENTSGDHGQALAMRLAGDREIITDCRIIGWQDTLRVDNGRAYFKDCYIAGRVDFIYGSATAWFENCELHSRNGGYVTAANTPEKTPFGFVFNQCRLTGDSIPWVSATQPAGVQRPSITPVALLGRPWRPFASVTYLNCEMGRHIGPEGWFNWGNASNEKTARYAEFNSTGPGANPDKRVSWIKQLTKEEADKITAESVLTGKDDWNPTAKASKEK